MPLREVAMLLFNCWGLVGAGDILVLQGSSVMVSKTHNDTNVTVRIAVPYVHSCDALNHVVQALALLGCVSHAFRSFANCFELLLQVAEA